MVIVFKEMIIAYLTLKMITLGILSREGLVSWANKFMVKQNALDSLLCLLKDNGHSELPTCARTLLQTCRTVSIQSKSGMEYIYFPLATQLLKHFKGYPVEAVRGLDTLEISINVDGLPLFKSSNKTLWPVLCAIINVTPNVVFPVVLTCGIPSCVDVW